MMMPRLRSIAFYVYGILMFALISLPFLMTIGLLLPPRLRQRGGGYTGILILKGLKPLLNLDYQIEDQRPPDCPPAIYVCNHQSAMETLMMPYLLNPVSPILKRELMWVPFIGIAMLLMGCTSIARNKGLVSVHKLKKVCENRQQKGVNILIFPEGTRYPAGCVGPFMPGAVAMAKAANMPLVPISMNSGSFWPPHTLIKNSGTARFVIGEPVSPDTGSAREINDQLRNWIIEQGNFQSVSRVKKHRR